MNTHAGRPLPVPTSDSAPFWEGCGEGELRFQRCRACGVPQFYPRMFCTVCGCSDLAWEVASGRGTVVTYTVIHRAPSPAFRELVPYAVGVIELEEGVRMMGNVVGCAPGELRCDLPVQATFSRVSDEIVLPSFAPRA